MDKRHDGGGSITGSAPVGINTRSVGAFCSRSQGIEKGQVKLVYWDDDIAGGSDTT